jgi:GNAT superfamily N-acetyltransferase
LDLADSAQTAVGVARLIRESSSATHGEWAVLVVDDYHGLGLGTILMATLYAQAQRVGLTTLRAYVLPDNAKGLSWLAYLGATLAEDGVPRILDLPVGGPFPRNGTAERFQQWVAGVNEALRRSQAGGSAGSERL